MDQHDAFMNVDEFDSDWYHASVTSNQRTEAACVNVQGSIVTLRDLACGSKGVAQKENNEREKGEKFTPESPESQMPQKEGHRKNSPTR